MNSSCDFDGLHVDPIGLDRVFVISCHDRCGAREDAVGDGWSFGGWKAFSFLSEVSFCCGKGLGEVFVKIAVWSPGEVAKYPASIACSHVDWTGLPQAWCK